MASFWTVLSIYAAATVVVLAWVVGCLWEAQRRMRHVRQLREAGETLRAGGDK